MAHFEYILWKNLYIKESLYDKFINFLILGTMLSRISISLFKLSCKPESLFLVSNLKNYEILRPYNLKGWPWR